MALKPGMLVYAKTIKTGVDKHAVSQTLKGHAITLLVGVAGPNVPAPNEAEFMTLLWNAGVISIDEIFEACGEKGEEMIAALQAHIMKKYPVELATSLVLAPKETPK